MKFKKEIIMGSGKTAYLLACSKEEIQLLFGIPRLATVSPAQAGGLWR